MKKIFVITSIQPKYKYLLGPSLVAMEISKVFKHQGYYCKFIDTYRKSKFGSLCAYLKIFSELLFTKKSTIFVHAQGYVTSSIFCLIQFLRPSHQITYTIHGLPLKENTYRSNTSKIPRSVYVQEIALKTIFLVAKKIICVSQLQVDYIKQHYRVNADTFVIHNGTSLLHSPDKLKSQQSLQTKRAIMAGGISNRKSIIETIEAFLSHNTNSAIKWRLDIYGNISDNFRMPLVSELCEQSQGFITYHGMLDQESLYLEMSKSDLYIAMSKWDTFNLAALQAMSFGTPCICSKQSGVSELIIHNMNGFLVDTNSAQIVADCAHILNNIQQLGDDYTKIQESAYKTASANNWTYVADKYLTLASSRQA